MFASDADADGDAKLALRIRAGWRHEWRRPPPNIKVHQIVPGPFKKRLPLVEDTPYYFIETKSLRRSRHTRRKRLSREMIAERRCAVIRTGIPDPWADYLTFRGTPSDITKVSAEDKNLWSERLDLTESAWKRHGIKLTQGIPNPWEYWPKLKGLESGDIECPCLKPKPLEDCPCENPAPAVEEIRREVQEVSFETKTRKTAKKMPPNTQARKKSLLPFKFWKKGKRTQPRQAVQPGWYQPLWEFEPQTVKSFGCSEIKPQPPAATFCECSLTKQLSVAKPSPEKRCTCSEKPMPLPVVSKQLPEKRCACSEKPMPSPVVSKPLPEKRCACSEKQPVVMSPPPPPVVAMPSPRKCCGCSEKPTPPLVVMPPPPPQVVSKPLPEKRCACSEKPLVARSPPPPPPPLAAKPSPGKCCGCSEKPKPPPVVKPPPPEVKPPPPSPVVAKPSPVVAKPSPGKWCGCSEKPNPPPVVKPPPPEVKQPPPSPVVAKPSPGKCCGCSEKPNPPPVVKPPPPVVKPPPPEVKPPPPSPVVAKLSAGKWCGCSEKPKPAPIEESPQVLLTAKHCGCSQLQAPQPRSDPIPTPVNYCECSLQREIQKPPPPPRPPPPKACECQAPMRMLPPTAPENQGVENYCELSDVKYNRPRVENKPSPGKSCGVTERRNSKQRPAEVLSSAQKVKACRETGYLQSTDSPVQPQEVTKAIDTRSTAIQCDSLECIQGETFVGKVEPTYLLDEAKPSRDLSEQVCSTCKTSCAEKDARKLDELWKDYEKRKETPHSASKPQNEHKTITEPNLIDIGEVNEDDEDGSNVPKRRGRMGSILKSGSYEHEQATGSEAPTKRVSITLPENESVDLYSADQEGAGARKKGGRIPHKASSGNISDVSSIARASAAGSVTSDTFLSMMNTATGNSGRTGRTGRSEGVSGKSEGISDEEVEIAEVDLSEMDTLPRRVSSDHDIGSIIQVKQGSVDTFYLKRPDSYRTGSLETQVALSDENVSPITYSNSKFQPNASWPREGSNPSVLSGLQTHMERIEEQFSRDDGRWHKNDNPNILQKKSSAEQFEEEDGSAVPEGTIDELNWTRANSSSQSSQEGQPSAGPDVTLDDGEGRDYFHGAGEISPGNSRATTIAEEPEHGLKNLATYGTPSPTSRQSGRSPRRFPYDKSRSSHIAGVPDLEPRLRPRCYACQMQEEVERLKVIENEKENKKRASSARRPNSSGSKSPGEKKRARTPNYWFEKRAKGMAYYADDEAVMIADPQAVKAKVSVIPKKPDKKLANSMRSRPRNSSRENEERNRSRNSKREEARNRIRLEQEVYRPKHMGKPREYDFLGRTVQGRGSGHGFPGIGMSATPETSVSENVVGKSPRTSVAANPSASSRQDTYLRDAQSPSSQKSSVGKVMDPPIQTQRSRNAKSPYLQNSNSDKATNPTKRSGYLGTGKGPISLPSGSENLSQIDTSHGYIETETKYHERQQQATAICSSGVVAGSSNACDVCCKPSVYNLLPNSSDSSNNRTVAESSIHRNDKLPKHAKSSNQSKKSRDYESESESLGPPPFQRKGYTKLDPCDDDECTTTKCSDRETKGKRPKRSGHKTEDRNRVLTEQEPVRPKHMGKTREYDYLARSGHHLLQSKITEQKSEGSCTSCCKSPDCFDPKHGHEGKSTSTRKSFDSCDFCCKTSECVSSHESKHLSQTSRNEMLSQQESVRPKHMGKTREYQLLGNLLKSQAPSKNKASKRLEKQNASKVPAHCPGPAYESNAFLVDPIELIQPSPTKGRSRAFGGTPSEISCECSSEEEAAHSTSTRRRPEEQRRKKNVGNIFVSQPRRH